MDRYPRRARRVSPHAPRMWIAGSWVYRRWRAVLVGSHLGAIAAFAALALIAAIALPGGFASAMLVVGIFGGLFLLFRLPITLRVARRDRSSDAPTSDPLD